MAQTSAEQDHILALDVAHQSIKIVAATRAEGKTVYKRAGVISTLRKGAPASLADILYLVKETMQPWNFQPNSIRVAISGGAVTVRFIMIPRTGKDQFLADIRQDSGKFIPVPLTDTYVDCDVLNPPAGGKIAEKNIGVIAAIKKEAVADLSKLLRGMELSASLLDASALCLFNAFEAYGEAVKAHGFKNYAVVDIGSHTTHLAIYKEEIPIFTREVIFGGGKITEAVSHGLSIDMEKAESSKRGEDPAAVPFVNAVLQPFSEELKNSFQFFETEMMTTVEGLYLTGGASLTPGLVSYLGEKLELPVHLWNPFESATLEMDEGMANMKKQGAIYAVCCGLVARTDKF